VPFAEHENALREAVVDVAESSFFAFAAPLDPGAFAALAAGASAWYATTVAFTGDLHGAIEVVVPEGLAASLVGGFLGADPGEPVEPDALRDGMGELANMICGTWLTRARRDGRFTLSPPGVSRCEAAPAAGGAGEDAAVHVSVNDLPLRVVVRGT
jgi:hypothetical protein